MGPRLMTFLTVAVALLLRSAEGRNRCMLRSFAIACIWPTRDDCKNGKTTFSSQIGKTCKCPATAGAPADEDTCWTAAAAGSSASMLQDDEDYYYYYDRRLEMVV
eukprot:TRINITY_DN41103_c0_g1_i1.p2 TRINITY_DN41103_c0_g1~~TRINITY_DN41103_c0_g1_i1.p2  ORF type:complete len:105 (-),score=26.39 TRINITY_DN41103_c0_g1_i1:233-547(-)